MDANERKVKIYDLVVEREDLMKKLKSLPEHDRVKVIDQELEEHQEILRREREEGVKDPV